MNYLNLLAEMRTIMFFQSSYLITIGKSLNLDGPVNRELCFQPKYVLHCLVKCQHYNGFGPKLYIHHPLQLDYNPLQFTLTSWTADASRTILSTKSKNETQTQPNKTLCATLPCLQILPINTTNRFGENKHTHVGSTRTGGP